MINREETDRKLQRFIANGDHANASALLAVAVQLEEDERLTRLIARAIRREREGKQYEH